jgi:hypothetical protein
MMMAAGAMREEAMKEAEAMEEVVVAEAMEETTEEAATSAAGWQ